MGLPANSIIQLPSKWERGPLNFISDVPGVTVGHTTHKDGDIQTGVTAILPHQGNLFHSKVMAGVSVINGFGKTIGLVQIEELGTIETPILLTNTLSVGTASVALIKYMLKQNPEIGVTTGTVNPLVAECNDGRLNDIQGFHVTEADVFSALAQASNSSSTEEGAIGGGAGMICFGLKGGIGSSSRRLEIFDRHYTIGALVMTNFGEPGNLTISGIHYDSRTIVTNHQQRDNGSVIIVIATDLPLSERQLKRVAKRATIALGRLGSYCGNGSGDIAIAFTTANQIPHTSPDTFCSLAMLHDNELDQIFAATADTVEEAIVSSLFHANTTVGIRGTMVPGLKELLPIN